MIYVDPPQTFVTKLLQDKAVAPDLCLRVIESSQDILSFGFNNQVTRPTDAHGMFGANGNDPWIDIPISLPAETTRYCAVSMACKAQTEPVQGQLFWAGDKRPGYTEDLSVVFPLIADGRGHTYLIDLHEGNVCGSINFRWRHRGSISRVRFDPLNQPGEFAIRLMAFLSEEYFCSDEFRRETRLSPARQELSLRYMHGCGIEVGALQNPLPVPSTSYVQYADKFTLEQARREYPELAGAPLVNPTIVCEATALAVPDQSLDFMIANHVLEHMRDPLAAVREWLRILRYGGHLYLAVPEHTNPLDKHRSLTTIEHMIADFEKRKKREAQDRAHFPDWVASVNFELPAEERARRVQDLIARNYAIHFHTFSRASFLALLGEATQRFGGELLECRVSTQPELVEFMAILRR